jgi:hypothetical protein|tara:strand:- start:2271 stop:2444 length:174 start_codon:yes stop_codon:yes gene_type:complete
MVNFNQKMGNSSGKLPLMAPFLLRFSCPARKRDMMDIQSMVIDSPLGSRPKGDRVRS